ncbi:MAG TPA: sigma-70 family RNA polymerase sigma factor [Gemmatimonadaceae bacterium]|jgi:RNA polymerase sigma-70 factor (ECF subfamily)
MAEQQVGGFEELVLSHLDDAYTLARYLLHDEHDAQDAVQDASLRAFRHFGGFRHGDARSWFLAIVRNCCYDFHKARRMDRSSVPFSDDTLEELPDPHAADELVLEGSESDRVRAAVDALPAELREVIVLRELSELSYREISDVVGVPMGTVMSRISRARVRLGAMLGADSRKAG